MNDEDNTMRLANQRLLDASDRHLAEREVAKNALYAVDVARDECRAAAIAVDGLKNRRYTAQADLARAAIREREAIVKFIRDNYSHWPLAISLCGAILQRGA